MNFGIHLTNSTRPHTSRPSGASSAGYRRTPRPLARRNVITSFCRTSVQGYSQRRPPDPGRREKGRGGGIDAEGEADGHQGHEHHGNGGAVEPGRAPAPIGGEPSRDHPARRDEEKGAEPT